MTQNTFYLDYNVSGAERKRLVEAISAYTQADAQYLGAPTFAYEVDYFTIEKNGCVTFDDRVDSEEIEGLIETLVIQGFVSQASNLGCEDAEVAEQDALSAEAEEPSQESEEAAEEPDSAEDAITEPVSANETGLTVSLPLDGFNPDSLDRLQKLVDAKASLIRKALGAEQLTIQASDGTVRFPWWDALPEPEETKAYTAFLAALCRMAKEAKRVTATEKAVESEKYAFRGFLLRLGFIGADCKEQRKLNKLSADRTPLLADLREIQKTYSGTDGLEQTLRELDERLNREADAVQDLIATNARVAQNQDEYNNTFPICRTIQCRQTGLSPSGDVRACASASARFRPWA